jgi:WD40 repeat protein
MLVSVAGDEKGIIVWKNEEVMAGDLLKAKDGEKWTVHQHMKDAHPGTLNYLSTYHHDGESYFVTMCGEGVLRVWAALAGGEFILKSELFFGRLLQESSALHALGKTQLILAVGGYDSKVHIYTMERGGEPSQLTY